jgi:hypothetical protein
VGPVMQLVYDEGHVRSHPPSTQDTVPICARIGPAPGQTAHDTPQRVGSVSIAQVSPHRWEPTSQTHSPSSQIMPMIGQALQPPQ